ncbi:MAG TPA: hypothetical protein VIM85_04575 [Pseudomonadales bacterium]
MIFSKVLYTIEIVPGRECPDPGFQQVPIEAVRRGLQATVDSIVVLGI